MFRVSELVHTPFDLTPLQCSDICISSWNPALLLTLQSSKFANRPVTIRLPPIPRGPCPVKLLARYIIVLPLSAGNFFPSSKWSPCHSVLIFRCFKEYISSLGLSYVNFKSHSFCISWATQLAIEGVPECVSQRMEQWKSAAYKSYIRPRSVVHLWSFLFFSYLDCWRFHCE